MERRDREAGPEPTQGAGATEEVPWEALIETLPPETQHPESFDRLQQVLTALVDRGAFGHRAAGRVEQIAEEDGAWRGVLELAKVALERLEER